MNSGGAHCLKYGVTVNNLMGLTASSPSRATSSTLGGAHLDAANYDWLGMHHRQRGHARPRHRSHRPHPSAPPKAPRAMLVAFGRQRDPPASAVDAIIGSGIIPVAPRIHGPPRHPRLRSLCQRRLPAWTPRPCSSSRSRAAPPSRTGSAGPHQAELCRALRADQPPRQPNSAEESLAIWKGRKGAFGAIGRISPDYLCMDGHHPHRPASPSSSAASAR